MAGLAGLLYKQPPLKNVVLSPKGEDLADVFLDKFLNAVFPDNGDGDADGMSTPRKGNGSCPVMLLSNLDVIVSRRLPAAEIGHAIPAGVYPCERVHLDRTGLDPSTFILDDGSYFLSIS